MTALSTRGNLLAVVLQTDEAIPVAPSAATQFIPIQDDFVLSPDFNVLENAELSPNIGKKKKILGSEKPTASGSLYVKPSGVEGQAPTWSPILEGVFGTKTVEGTQRTLTSGSTVSELHYGSGIGANLARGYGVLIKDGVNGYRIRVVDSVATDVATLSFNLPNAPATGVTTGKPVYYSPAASGHKSMTLWQYIANGGDVAMIAGAKVTSFATSPGAGELMNSSISLEGVAFYWNPVTLATDLILDWTDDDDTWAATVAAGTYKDPVDFADAVASAMNAVSTGQTAAVTYDSATGKYTVKTTGTLLSLLFSSGTNTASTIAAKLGFSAAADQTGTGATTGYTSATAIDLAATYAPTYDNVDPIAAKGQEVMLGDATDYVCFEASAVSFTVTNTRTENKSICATSGVSGSVITGREVKGTVKALLGKYDASKFARYRKNSDTRFQYSFGTKSGGNWIAGKCGYIYVPTCTVTSFKITNDSGLASLEMEISAFVNANNEGEAYLGFL